MRNCGLEMWSRAEKRGRRWELEKKWFQKETPRSLRRLMGKKVKHSKKRRGRGATGEPVTEPKLPDTGWAVHLARCRGARGICTGRLQDREGDRGKLHPKLRQEKGTFSSDENSFLSTSPN